MFKKRQKDPLLETKKPPTLISFEGVNSAEAWFNFPVDPFCVHSIYAAYHVNHSANLPKGRLRVVVHEGKNNSKGIYGLLLFVLPFGEVIRVGELPFGFGVVSVLS